MFSQIRYLPFLCALLLANGCDPASFLAQKTPPSVVPTPQTSEWAEDWWLPRHQTKKAQLDKQAIDLVFLGDSITHGWEHTGLSVWSRYYATRNAFNLGFSGDRTEHVLWRIENGALDNIHPQLLVLLIGTNNTGQRMDAAEDTALGIKTIIKQIQYRLPKTKILLLAIFPMKFKPNDPMRQRNEQINKIIAHYADNKNIFFLNLNYLFLDDQNQIAKQYMPDFLHPSTQGYQRWAEAMEPSIVQLMNKK